MGGWARHLVCPSANPGDFPFELPGSLLVVPTRELLQSFSGQLLYWTQGNRDGEMKAK